MNEQIIIAMKPLDKNFVDNALDRGVAGINIDGSRITTSELAKDGGIQKKSTNDFFVMAGGVERTKGNGANSQLGRFPANIILQHHEECKKIGTKKVKGITGGGRTKNPIRKKGIHAEYKGHQSEGREQSYVDYADDEGQETVEEWNCHSDCPIRIIDEQSKEMGIHSAGNVKKLTLDGTMNM